MSDMYPGGTENTKIRPLGASSSDQYSFEWHNSTISPVIHGVIVIYGLDKIGKTT